MTTPATLRDQGIALAEQAADPRLILMIDDKIAELNASGRAWSANDLRDMLPVVAGPLIGARVRAAATRRPVEMEEVGRVPSSLRSTHAHKIALWRGVGAEAVA
jgi:hypothetical protein